MDVEAALFADIRANLDDDLPRLAYADWLEENGDETARLRAELIRLHCVLADSSIEAVERVEKRLRAKVVFEELKRTWFAPLIAHVPLWKFDRGFVEKLGVNATHFFEHGEVLRSVAPVAEITVFVQAGQMQALAESPSFCHVRRLVAFDTKLNASSLRALARTPFPPNIEGLHFARCSITAAGMRELVRMDLSRLRALRLAGNRINDDGVELVCCASSSRLASLDLAGNRLKLPSAQALARATELGALTELELGRNALDDEAIETLAGSANLQNVRQLDLSSNCFSTRGALALARSKHLDALTFLEVRNNELDEDGWQALSDRFGSRVLM